MPARPTSLLRPSADQEIEAAYAVPVEVVQPEAAAPVLIVCDHASNHIPDDLSGLGLPQEELDRHIGWDIGAAKVGRRLAGRLGATAVLSGVSRLVIDCNRPLGHPTSICLISDGTTILGNHRLTAGAAAGRADDYFHPYHRKIADQLARIEAVHGVAQLIAVHSFTPVMNGRARPWQVGILWNRDPRLARPLIEALSAEHGLEVGDNQPYSGRDANYTTDVHGGDHGRAHVSIEIRQDEIARDADALAWGDRLAEILRPVLARPENAVRRRY